MRTVEELLEETIVEMRNATALAAPEADPLASDALGVPIGRPPLPSTDAVVADTLPHSEAPPSRARRSLCTRAFAVATSIVVGLLVLEAAVAWRPTVAALPSVRERAAVQTAPSPAAAITPSSASPLATSAPRTQAATRTTGTIHVTTMGRRIFLDGRLMGEGPRTIRTSCGDHKLQVGSAGARISIEVPCGGEVAIGKR